MKEWFETGRTVEEAIEKACEKNSLNRDDIQWEIVDLPRKSFFGLKKSPAKVRLYVEEEEQAPVMAPPKGPEPKPVQTRKPEQPKAGRDEVKPVQKENEAVLEPDPAKEAAALEYLGGILKAMELSPEISISYDASTMLVELSGENLGAVIGKRGETLDAIQYLTSLAINKGDGEYQRLTINCGNYREKRKATLEALAKKVAGQVIRTGGSTTLEPMNPFERRIIHATVSGVAGAKSVSVGVEPNRRVVISSAGARKSGGDRRSSGGGRGGRQAQRRGGGESGRGGREGDRRPPRREEPRPEPVAAKPNTQKVTDAGDTPLYAKIDLDHQGQG